MKTNINFHKRNKHQLEQRIKQEAKEKFKKEKRGEKDEENTVILLGSSSAMTL